MPRRSQPVPPGWAQYAAREGNLKLRRRFNVGGLTIERWRRETGVYYAAQAMPKRAPTRPIKVRKMAKRMAAERIEDLDDGFDLRRSLGIRGF